MYGFKNGIKAHSVSIVDSEWSPHEPDRAEHLNCSFVVQ